MTENKLTRQGVNPVTVKVGTPPSHKSAAIQTALSDTDVVRNPSVDETPTPAAPVDKSDLSADATAYRESLVRDPVVSPVSNELGKNTAPMPKIKTPRKSNHTAKGTPGAGKLLKRSSGVDKAVKEGEDDPGSLPVTSQPNVSQTKSKAKSPLGAAKTVASVGKGKAKAT
jgi:hypothetical protein